MVRTRIQNQSSSPLASELPLVVAAQRILTPTINVFLGSTAGLAGLELMRHMLTLRSKDQRKVAMVYIDTDDQPAPLVAFRRQHNNVFQEFLLRIAVPTGISNADHIDQTDQHTFIEEKVPQYFANGAGGIRNNGHVAACFNYQYIYDVLDKAIVSISHLGVEQNTSSVHEVQANVVAFLGGGTGSGTIVDIAVMVRDLLASRQYKQRLNLFCLLPEPMSGVQPNDLNWRKSNATAGLLEILAYSRAAANDPIAGYKKYMRGKAHRLTNDPIANEVYLVGHSSMTDAGDTARIVGLDLYQRITDASSVGFLEHSKYVDRRTLGTNDNRGLPTMFGTSCPMEVRFPAEEMATAYAQISASYLLPLLAGYQPVAVNAGEADRQAWKRKWNKVARLDANVKDPQVMKINEFRHADFEDAAQSQLDILWGRLERSEQANEQRIREIIEATRREELNIIKSIPQPGSDADGSSLIDRRIRHLRSLVQEYSYILETMRDREAQKVPRRPNDLESKLVRQPRLPGPLQMLSRDYAGAVCEAYNERMRMHVRAMRHRLLEGLLKDLLHSAQETLNQSLSWFRDADADGRSRALREKAITSMAWQGKLDHFHPHQRHLFDLETLNTLDGHNLAVEQLYRWAAGGDRAIFERKPFDALDYRVYLSRCAEYLSQYTPTSDEGDELSIDSNIAGSRLGEHIVNFFKGYYLYKFADMNLFELLNKAAPPPGGEQTRVEQIEGYLLEHLKHVKGLMRNLITFEAHLWSDGLSILDTSLYLGMYWRDGNQEGLLDSTLKTLGALTRQGDTPIKQLSYDPHRLEVSYGRHAISFNTIRDFYLEENSAMEYYMENQRAWKTTKGKGLMPVHSSGEAQRLVTDAHALGYTLPLIELVIRRTTSNSSNDKHKSSPPGADARSGMNGTENPGAGGGSPTGRPWDGNL